VDPLAFGVQQGPGEPAPPPPAPRRSPGRVAAAVLVPLAALAAVGIGFAISGGSPSYDAGARPGSGAAAADVAARAAWRSASADQILPAQLHREGTEVYYRLAVDPDESCAQLPGPFVKALGPGGCDRVVQATYLDSTESVVATVGLVAVGGTAADRQALFQNWTADSYARQYAMMPSTYPVRASLAVNFGNGQRVAWKSAITNDGSYIAFTVSGFADGRLGPTAAAFNLGSASELQSDSPPVQVADDLSSVIMTDIGALYPAGNGTQE
jgi:hypothetical protein